MPEQRDLFLQRTPGRDHAIQPGGSSGVKLAQLRLIHMVATDEVLWHNLWVAGVEQFLDHCLVAFGDRGLEFITRRTKPGTAQQMRHECHVLLMHASVSLPQYTHDTAVPRQTGYCVPQLAPPVWRGNEPCAAPVRSTR